MSQAIASRHGGGCRAMYSCVAVMLAIAAVGLISHADRYLVGDLQLISWESVEEGEEPWSGPVEAATILAWYAGHGYSWLLPDLNDDGFIDKEDTAGLAGILGRVFMETVALPGTTDPALVWGIGAYLAEVAGNHFGIRVYDAGFDDEWRDDPPDWRLPDEIPGVDVELLDDPSFADFRFEMAGGAMTILGLEGIGDHLNVYFAGRSFSDGSEDDAVSGIGLASSNEDPCRAGVQGRIIDTASKSTTAWWVRVDGRWYEVEFMLALWPTASDASASVPSAPDLVAEIESTSFCGESSQGGGSECSIQWRTTITNNNPEFRVPRTFKVEQRVDLAPEFLGNPVYQYLSKYVEGDLLRELNETGHVSFDGRFTWFADSLGNPSSEYEVSVLADARCEIDEFTAEAEANNHAVTRGNFSREVGESVPGAALNPGESRDIVPVDIGSTSPTEERCSDLAIEIVDTSCQWESGISYARLQIHGGGDGES